MTKTIYGLSIKYPNYESAYVVAFNSEEKAKKWLETEEYDFRDRQLCNKKQIEKILGKYEARIACKVADQALNGNYDGIAFAM